MYGRLDPRMLDLESEVSSSLYLVSRLAVLLAYLCGYAEL